MPILRKPKQTINESLLGYDGTNFPAYAAVKACLEAPVFEYNGARKIVQSVAFSLPSIPPVDLEQVGYNTKIKMGNLDRMYYNPAEAKRVVDLLERRSSQAFSALEMSLKGHSTGSVLVEDEETEVAEFSFRAGDKDPRSMGHCLSSMMIGLTRKRTTVEVVYRSTEVIKKHCADLAFLPVVFDRLGIKPDVVKFYFTHAFLSGVFFPTLFRWWDPITFLDLLRTREPKLFVVATRFLKRSVLDKDKKFPFSPEQHQHDFAWEHYPEKMPIINTYLQEYLK